MTTPVGGTPGIDSSVYGVGDTTTALGQNGSASGDQDMFLKLLVAQLKYQSPSSPADPTAYISEMAQFTQVQTLEAIKSQQQQLLVSNQLIVAEGMIGGEVTGTGDAGKKITGLVTSVTPTSDGATLTLSDGTTLPVSAVTALGIGLSTSDSSKTTDDTAARTA